MVNVVHRPDKIIEKHREKIALFYSQIDNWVPCNYMKELLKAHPSISAEFVAEYIPHGFVETQDHSLEMADLIYDFLKQKCLIK